MKRILLIALVLGLGLILLSACGKEDVKEVKDFVEEKDLEEKVGCTTLCYKLAVKTGQEIDSCAKIDLGSKCAEYFRTNPVSIKEFQGELSIFEQGGGGIAETGIAIDCSDVLLTLEDIKPLGPNREDTPPYDVISFHDYSGGFVNLCKIEIRAEEIPPGDTSGDLGKYTEGGVEPDLIFTSSSGVITLSRYPNEYYATGDLERDINIVYQRKYEEKSAEGGVIVPFDLGDSAYLFEDAERYEKIRRSMSKYGMYELIDYSSNIDVFVRAGNCLLEDLHVGVGRQNRKLNDFDTLNEYHTTGKYTLEPIPEITEEEKEKARNIAKNIAATILENAGCLS